MKPYLIDALLPSKSDWTEPGPYTYKQRIRKTNLSRKAPFIKDSFRSIYLVHMDEMKDRSRPAVITTMRNQAVSKTVIAVTAVVLVVVTGMYLYSKRDGGNVALKTYTNTVYGVSFDYPETYDLTEMNVAEGDGSAGEAGTVVTLIEKGTRTPRNGEGPTAITVEMYDNSVTGNVKENPVEDWILNATTSNWRLSRQDRPGETRIGEKDALLYTWDGLYQGTSVVTEHNGNIIMFTVTYDGEMDLEKREDFTNLMETVRFADTDGATSTPVISITE